MTSGLKHVVRHLFRLLSQASNFQRGLRLRAEQSGSSTNSAPDRICRLRIGSLAYCGLPLVSDRLRLDGS
jgi:hypothetical protein